MGRAMDWMVCGYRKNWENLGGRLAGRGGGDKICFTNYWPNSS